MPPFVSALHIFLAVLAYLVVAMGTVVLVKKRNHDLKEMAGRTRTTVLLLGGVANLIVLATTLLLVVGLDHAPLSALGLTFSRQDGLFALLGAASTVVLAAGFVWWRQRGQEQQAANRPATGAVQSGRLLVGVLVLLVVAVQEEVLYRGYMVLNLSGRGGAWILIITTAIFVLIHFFTNRVDRYQIASWTVSGLVLAGAYLASGSIWVPIILHLATDLTNVVVFNITGQPPGRASSVAISARDRAAYRGLYGVTILLLLVAFYHPALPTLL